MSADERVARGTVVLGPDDAGELLTLQLAAWVREAIVNDDLDIPPLHESVDDVRTQLETLTIWGLREQGRLVGTVRMTPIDDTTVLLGRLGVVPDLFRQGLGGALLRYAEGRLAPEIRRIELITGLRSAANHSFYGRHGYEIVERIPEHRIVKMAKVVRTS